MRAHSRSSDPGHPRERGGGGKVSLRANRERGGRDGSYLEPKSGKHVWRCTADEAGRANRERGIERERVPGGALQMRLPSSLSPSRSEKGGLGDKLCAWIPADRDKPSEREEEREGERD